MRPSTSKAFNLQIPPSLVAVSPVAAQAAHTLLEHIDKLKVSYGCERSFRLCPGALLPHRFLLSLAMDTFPVPAHQNLLAICRHLSMPEVLCEEMCKSLPLARFIHFGFEEGKSTFLYKIYLELSSGIDHGDQVDGDHILPVLLHLSFKWDPSSEKHRHVSRYSLFPSLPIQEIAARIIGIYGEGREGTKQLALDLLAFVASQLSRDDIRYLEVREDDNERCSFDLNCYDAEFTVRDFGPLFKKMCRLLEVPRQPCDALWERIQDRRLGHLAGGVHRNGDEFFTIYYGVEGRRG